VFRAIVKNATFVLLQFSIGGFSGMHYRGSGGLVGPLMCLFFTGIGGLEAQNASGILGAEGLAVSVDPKGAYSITVPNPAWQFGGNVGYPLTNMATVSGVDAAGHYSEISFDFKSDILRHGAIRAYWNRQAVLFTLTLPSAGSNNFSFPNLKTYPAGLSHLGFSGVFANPSFTTLPEEGPWAFFDDSGNTFVISPAANFMVESKTIGADGTISSGIDTAVSSLPQGFTHQTLLVAGQGIDATFRVWGQTLTSLLGKGTVSNDADLSLRSLGYWTDNGANYYYRMENSMTYPQTLEAVRTDFNKQGIGLGYVQLDSWFYPKGANYQWSDSADGLAQYSADATLFPAGLNSFQGNLGVPLITHARWIDPTSPYRQQYKMSGNVSIDPAYWAQTAAYLKSSGVATYEQDWLYGPAITAFNLTDGAAFLDNMASAMAGQKLTMQYCMPTARHVLQSAKYPNLTTIRGAQDRFEPGKWTAFLYASRLIGAVGAWPFSDVFMSTETSNLLLATLSAGPVGVGDQIGTMNTANLLRAVRADGIIVKPDSPITPLDASYIANAQSLDRPMIATTSTSFDNWTAHYVFAYPQGSNNQVSFTPASLGITGDSYVYDYFAGSGGVARANDTISATITGDSQYWIVTPIGPSGMALLGDTGQFVTVGRKRVKSVSDDGAIHLTVAFASGEISRRIEGFSPGVPRVSTTDGSISNVVYDRSSHRFNFAVAPGAQGSAAVMISRGGARAH
jgi:hypothetical protein